MEWVTRGTDLAEEVTTGIIQQVRYCNSEMSETISLYTPKKTRLYLNIFFSPSGSHAILVFPYQMAWQYSDRNPANGGVECKWDRQKSRSWANIWLHCVLWTVLAASAIYLADTDHGEFITLVTGKRRVCWWRETTTKCMTRSLTVTTKTTLRSGKSEASARVIVLLRLTTDRHKASRGLSATAELLVYHATVSQDVCLSIWRRYSVETAKRIV